LNRKFSDNFTFSFIHIAAGVTKTDTTNAMNFGQTTGIYSNYTAGNINFWTDAYYQYGKNRQGISRQAFMFDAELNYKIENLTPVFGFAYLSGNNKTITGASIDNLFEGIYRSRHSYFGGIDYFTLYDTHTKSAGLIDYYFYINYKFSKSFRVLNTAHYFQLAHTNPATPNDKNLGFENDLLLRYKFNDWGVLETGYFFFLPTETLKTIQKVPNNKFLQFFNVQLTLTPTLFKQKEEKEEKI
jgi:hypothetical protein